MTIADRQRTLIAMSTPEIELMGQVDTIAWDATEPDEQSVLDGLFPAEPTTMARMFRVGSLAPNQAANVLNEARKWIGTSGRPNTFTRWYSERHGREFLSTAWCDIFVSFVARHAKADALLPSGERAYTPWHVDDFARIGRAHAGTEANVRKHAAPGSVIFFDWGGSNDADRVDHVGLCLRQLDDGRIVTIEGNTSDSCQLRVRSASVIAVICTPAYAERETPPANPAPAPSSSTVPWPYKSGTLMRRGWQNSAGVKRVQKRINALGYRPRLVEDGDFGRRTEEAVRWVQRKYKISADGIVGRQTWGKLFG